MDPDAPYPSAPLNIRMEGHLVLDVNCTDLNIMPTKIETMMSIMGGY